MNKKFFPQLIKTFNNKIGVTILLGVVLLIIFSFNSFKGKEENLRFFHEGLHYNSQNKLIESFDFNDVSIEKWNVYQDKKLGFKLKYPNNWFYSVVENKKNETAWDKKIVFRNKDEGLSKKEAGFDIFVYNTKKIDSETSVKVLGCKLSRDIYLENQGCLRNESVLVTKNEEYIYKIVPALVEESIFKNNKNIPLNCDSNELIAALNSFDTINIVRPKPKPVITAPYPVSYKRVNGKLVCAKENDKPRKSKKDKGHHLDMECCLDPDEDPNPWCTYF